MIYVIHAPVIRRAKIGIAVNPDSRLSALQTGCPVELKLWAKWETPNDARLERVLHERYVDFYVRGEWFEDVIFQDIFMERSRDLSVITYRNAIEWPPFTWDEVAVSLQDNVIPLDAFRPSAA